MTIRAKLYAAIVLTILGPLDHDRRGLHGIRVAERSLRRGRRSARDQPGARARAQVRRHGLQRLADRLRLRRRRAAGRCSSARSQTSATCRGRATAADRPARARAAERARASLRRVHGARRVAYRALQARARAPRASESSSGPRSASSRRWRAAPTSWPLRGAAPRRPRSAAFDERATTPARLIAVALGAGVADRPAARSPPADVARLALERQASRDAR